MIFSNNPCCSEPGHANLDRLGAWHEGGGNYIAIDGHSEYYKPGDSGLERAFAERLEQVRKLRRTMRPPS